MKVMSPLEDGKCPQVRIAELERQVDGLEVALKKVSDYNERLEFDLSMAKQAGKHALDRLAAQPAAVDTIPKFMPENFARMYSLIDRIAAYPRRREDEISIESAREEARTLLEIIGPLEKFTAPPAQARPVVPEGYVLVRKEAIDWLNGESDFECPPDRYFRGQPPRYWWRSVFREKAGLAAPSSQEREKQE